MSVYTLTYADVVSMYDGISFGVRQMDLTTILIVACASLGVTVIVLIVLLASTKRTVESYGASQRRRYMSAANSRAGNQLPSLNRVRYMDTELGPLPPNPYGEDSDAGYYRGDRGDFPSGKWFGGVRPDTSTAQPDTSGLPVVTQTGVQISDNPNIKVSNSRADAESVQELTSTNTLGNRLSEGTTRDGFRPSKARLMVR